MKNILLLLATVLVFDLFLARCANPISPSGGPKDSIPPSLIESDPVNGSIDFNDQTITLEFSEFISADKLTQNLIITPKSSIRFKHTVKRNELVIKFEEPFNDSTTYSLNFFDGVTDITEKSPAVNLILAFSTGDYIDSMKVSGNVSDLLTQVPSKKFIVGLYPVSDTLNFLTDSPTYFTTVNDSGNFNMSYIKTGVYRILTFKDENRNLLLDPKDEDHGFKSDTLLLYDSIPDIQLYSLLQNINPIELVNNRPIRAYHEIKFNREISSYSIQPDSIYSSITGTDKDVLRLYNAGMFTPGDSTIMYLQAYDSLNNSVQDTLKIVFNEDTRQPPALTMDLKYSNNMLISDPLYTIRFNKPIWVTDQSKFIYRADSTFTYLPDSVELQWNENKTEVQVKTFLNKDSLYLAQMRSVVLDSTKLKLLSADSLGQISGDKEDSLKQLIANKSSVEFFVDPVAFISVEADSSEVLKITHKKSYKQAIGTLKLVIETEKPSFKVQLLTSRGEVAYESINNSQPSFDVKPASYSIRVLIDSNEDGKWTFGNLLQNIEPESVYLFPETVSIRENWIVEDVIISF